MKSIELFFILLFCIGLNQCTQVNNKNIRLIEGYWEIESVQAHGEIFQPKGNAPIVDYYYFSTDSTGIKKKLSPSVMGRYETSENQLRFTIHKENGVHALHFHTTLEEWKEEIKNISTNRLVLLHNEMEYHYVRHKKHALNVK